MVMNTRTRSSLYQSFVSLVGEEEAEAMLAEFPAKASDEPITKDYLGQEMAKIRTEMAHLENRLYVAMVGTVAIATGIILAVGR